MCCSNMDYSHNAGLRSLNSFQRGGKHWRLGAAQVQHLSRLEIRDYTIGFVGSNSIQKLLLLHANDWMLSIKAILRALT